MNKSMLGKMTTKQLVDQFSALAEQQNDAILGEDDAEASKLFWHLIAVQDELKARSGDQRTALMSLYAHSNMQVWLMAAKATLAVAPATAREQLETIEASHVQPQAGEAGMSLWNLDRGVFKPT